MHGHLVTVEVGVERRTHERVDLDGLALDQLRLERLDAQTVQRRCAVEQHRVLADDLFQNVPHDRALTLDHALGGLDVLGVVEIDQPLHHERLEQLQRHLLGQTALVQLEPRADDDDGTTRVVNALAEQVLTEPALLALEHVGQRLQRPVTRTGDRTTATTVVEQRVDGLLEHPLLVVDDDLGRAEVDQPLEAVVPVDHAAVQVVEVGRREPATVELNHRAQVRRDDRHAVEHHAERRVRRVEERRDDLEALERADLALALAGTDRLAKILGLGVEVHELDQSLDGLGTHAAGEVLTEAVAQLAVEQFVGDELLRVELAERVHDLVETVDLTLRTVTHLAHLALARLLDLAAHVGLGTLGLELGEIGLELGGPLLDLVVTRALGVPLLRAHLRLDGRHVPVTGFLVDARHDVRREVDDLLKVFRSQVEQVAQPARHTLEVPDVRDRGGQLDVAHPLTTDLGPGHLDAAALTDDALEPDALVFAAVALPVAGRAEDLLAEESVLFRLERAVVNGLGLLDLAMRPLTDVVSRSKTDSQLVEVIYIEHLGIPRVVKQQNNHGAGCGATRLQAAPRPDYLNLINARDTLVRTTGRDRYRALPPRGTPRRRSRAFPESCRRWRAPRRSGTATAAP